MAGAVGCDFSILINENSISFLTEYLPVRRNVSENTIKSYRDTFKLFLIFCRDVVGMKVERIGFADINPKLIGNFFEWLAGTRGCPISSCNQRLAALRSFFRYAQIEVPEYINLLQHALTVPMKKTTWVPVSYLNVESVRLLLKQPDTETVSGRRDMTLFAVLYDTGARIQELVDLSVKDLRLEHPAKARLNGKGRKTRDVPLMDGTVALLLNYLNEQKSGRYVSGDEPLFATGQEKE